jgi:hypothetical protein
MLFVVCEDSHTHGRLLIICIKDGLQNFKYLAVNCNLSIHTSQITLFYNIKTNKVSHVSMSVAV